MMNASRIHAMFAAALTGACGAFAWATTQSAPASVPRGAEVVMVAANDAAPRRGDTRPSRITIPALGISAAIEHLHRVADGTLTTPADWSRAGWYADGVVPGDRGPAVIVGHRDSIRAGPAVFYRLSEMQPGGEIFVERGDGRILRFIVDGTQQFAKSAFPTDFVYGPRPVPLLRLLTCAGTFDRRAGAYVDNLVVTAHQASVVGSR
jgi:Sortase domain